MLMRLDTNPPQFCNIFTQVRSTVVLFISWKCAP